MQNSLPTIQTFKKKPKKNSNGDSSSDARPKFRRSVLHRILNIFFLLLFSKTSFLDWASRHLLCNKIWSRFCVCVWQGCSYKKRVPNSVCPTTKHDVTGNGKSYQSQNVRYSQFIRNFSFSLSLSLARFDSPFPSSEVDESVPVEWTPDRQKVPLPVSLDYKKQHPYNAPKRNPEERRES